MFQAGITLGVCDLRPTRRRSRHSAIVTGWKQAAIQATILAIKRG